MDMIVAFVVLVLSVCLMIVSFAVLKFTITFTVTEEYREIGVMKAIGITDFKIRSLYLVKYLMLAVVGAAIGFLASIPFGNMLLQSVTENMMLGNSHAITVNFMSAVIVIAVTIWFAYRWMLFETVSPENALKRNPFTGWEKVVLTVPGIWQSMIF